MAPRFFYPDTPDLPLPEKHRFPISKYRLLREKVMRERLLGHAQLVPSPLASRVELQRAHSDAYVMRVLNGTLSPAEQRQIGLPWSPTLARRSRATVGGSLAAARQALLHGVSGQLAGGTHHAHREFGSGYCVFNDLAVAALTLLAERLAGRVAILDLDVHQGDGNSAILAPNPDVFVASVHGELNFPFTKIASDLDIGLPDGTGDIDYLAAVEQAFEAIAAFNPDILLYLAGADALESDSLGRLSVSAGGLAERDRFVMRRCRAAGLPLSIVAGGGYAKPIAATVDAYAATWSAAREVFEL
ncbi:MAG: histone deacetylase [Alphaproteobacteria bacterium]|nr:histone deacetylase [Alphaproteobacteria bacterium]